MYRRAWKGAGSVSFVVHRERQMCRGSAGRAGAVLLLLLGVQAAAQGP